MTEFPFEGYISRLIRRIFENVERFIPPYFRPSMKIHWWMKKPELIDYETPLFDIHEEPEELIALIDLPGVRKEDIELRVTKNEIEVKAPFTEEIGKIKKFKGYYFKSTLPSEINPEETKASYQNGVLKVRMKKAKVPGVKIPIE